MTVETTGPEETDPRLLQRVCAEHYPRSHLETRNVNASHTATCTGHVGRADTIAAATHTVIEENSPDFDAAYPNLKTRVPSLAASSPAFTAGGVAYETDLEILSRTCCS